MGRGVPSRRRHSHVAQSANFGIGIVKVTGFVDAQRDMPSVVRRSTLPGRATPPRRQSVSACTLGAGDEMAILIEMVVDLGVN